jgi:quercetin dioxygenase-like cupin family protein
MAGGGNSIKHRDEFESMPGSGGCTWMLARKALGTRGFGFNLVELAPGGALPEHDESGSGQVELYVILEGDAVVAIDGEEHPAPAGTFASIEPTSTRTIRNHSEAPVTAMLVGVVPSADYQPPAWA